MTGYGELGYSGRVGSCGAFRSEGMLTFEQIKKRPVDPRAAGLSDLEIEAINRMDVRTYEDIAKMRSEEYLVQEYIKRATGKGEFPDLRIISGLRGKLD